ncbi:hypothetical protein SynBIOSU31_02260 [Synechococcus sp. BIOS-U3-1]|nr:hypothetical protein SynBIOSU31_02260 [Synechococcus sp. BIOS-U3-1]
MLTAPVDGELTTVVDLLMQPHLFFHFRFQVLEDRVIA